MTRPSRRLMIWLLPHPLPPLSSVSSTGDTQEDWEREQLAVGRGGASDDREKALSSINRSILSDKTFLGNANQWTYSALISSLKIYWQSCAIVPLTFNVCMSVALSWNIYLVRVVSLYFSERSLQRGKIVLHPLEFLHLGLRVAVQKKNNNTAYSQNPALYCTLKESLFWLQRCFDR